MRQWITAMLVVLLSQIPATAHAKAPDPIIVTKNGAQPQAAMSADGVVHVVWGANGSIFCASSKDNGKSFTDPVLVAELPKLALGMRRGPRIAATKDALVVAAIRSQGDLYGWRSEDGGKTWSKGVVVNDQPNATREGLFNIAAGPDASLYAVWLDLRTGKTTVMGSISSDGGKTWQKNVLIYRSPDGHVCECCHPSVAVDSKGVAYVMFRNFLGENRDMYLTHSSDGFKTFSEAQKLGEGTWPLNLCPMDGGSLQVMPNGKVLTAWQRDGRIYRCEPGQKEELIGSGTQPVFIPDQADLVWTDRDKVIHGKASLSPGAFPAVVASPRNDPLIVFWEVTVQKEHLIQALRLD